MKHLSFEPKYNVVRQLSHTPRYAAEYLSKYPKFLLLFITFVIAYLMLYGKTYQPLHNSISSLGYFGIFLAGGLFAYGFTAAPATAILLILAKEQNILLAGFIGGFGALVGDLIIFHFIRHSFEDEIEKLKNEKMVQFVYSKAPNIFRKYFVPALAGFIIASPLPDEIGVSLLAAISKISTKMFSIVSYALNTAGIFAILILGNMI